MELFVFWLLCAIAAAALLSRYNKAGTGFLLGAFLGPFGLVFALIIRSGEAKKDEQKKHEEQLNALAALKANDDATRTERECPYCAEHIRAKARVCKHCGRDVEPLET